MYRLGHMAPRGGKMLKMRLKLTILKQKLALNDHGVSAWYHEQFKGRPEEIIGQAA